ncbi:MAG: helix-turn-helix transcriptional regulator [Pseudomonadota bacterium]
MERLRAVLPFDSGVWASGLRSTNTVISVTLVDHDPGMLAEYAERWQAEDFVRAAAVANPGVAFRNEDVMALPVYHQTPIYREFSARAGIEHALGAVQADGVTDLGELIFLFRAESVSHFTEEERAALELLTPHMAAAWRQRQIAHYYQTAVGERSERPLGTGANAVIDGAGLIYAADDEFSLAMRTGFPQWAGPIIPPRILPILDAPNGTLVEAGFEFCLTRGDERHVLTVVAANREHRLTPAELRVARLFAAGWTHSRIASELGVSHSTVRNQIASIYRKLEIHSKAELARMVPPTRDEML